MTVYVDDFWRWRSAQLGQKRMSHMIADTEAELHSMAVRIGLSREHYQSDHYDVSKKLRGAAIHFGAVQVTVRELAAMVKLRRAGHPIGTPEFARQRWCMYVYNKW